MSKAHAGLFFQMSDGLGQRLDNILGDGAACLLEADALVCGNHKRRRNRDVHLSHAHDGGGLAAE